MKRTTGTNIARGTGLALVLTLAWFSTQALAPFSPSDQEPKGQRIAALDGIEDIAWLGNDQVIEQRHPDLLALMEGSGDRKQVDLSSQTTTSLPPLPPMQRHYGRLDNPLPSPNGQWLLYLEYRNATELNSKDALRYRLTQPDGSQTRFLPPDGQFHVKDIALPHWLPDGSGWVELDVDSRSADLYLLATPNAAPKHLPLPNETGISRHCSITRDGNLAILQGYRDQGYFKRLIFVPLHEGQAARSPVELTKSLPKGGFEFPGHHGGGSWPYSFSQADSMVVRLRFDDSTLMAWAHRLLHKPTSHREYWQVFYDGRPPRRLFSTTENIYYFSLSPDGKRLIYWQDDKAYLYTLP